MKRKIMLFCKKTLYCEYAIKILESYYKSDQLLIVRGDVGTKIDEELQWYRPEYIISFLSPWILPSGLLRSAQKAAINFHPGSPRYPGAGCYNFALYERAEQYGVTCHHMEPSVDSGKIVMTSDFPIAPMETVESLKLKAMNYLLFLFEKVIGILHRQDMLPASHEKWLREPYTRKKLNALCRIDPSTMDEEEIRLRVRATDYCSHYDGAYIEVGGQRFSARSAVKEPLV